MDTSTFICSACRVGTVATRSGPGRTIRFRRSVPKLPVPEALGIPTCDHCGEVFVPAELEDEVARQMGPVHKSWLDHHINELVNTLIQRHGATKRQVAAACGITPSHLSHVLSGADTPSLTLVRLLEGFVVCQEEFERCRDGLALSECSGTLYELLVHASTIQSCEYTKLEDDSKVTFSKLGPETREPRASREWRGFENAAKAALETNGLAA